MTKWIVVIVIFTLASFFVTPLIWPNPADMIPTPSQLPFFILLSVIESLSFGIGVAFLLFGYPVVKKAVPSSKKLALFTYLAIAWLIISWWPHDNLHKVNGMNLQGLLYIEYGFHVSLILTGVFLAYIFFHPLVFEAKKGK
jgi:hypothetical protein